MSISGVDIKAMREAVEEMLPDLCDIYAPMKSSNGAGGTRLTWPADSDPTYRDVPCEFRTRMVSEQTSGGRYRQVRMFDVVMPWDTDVDTDARIRANDGRLFQAAGVSRDQSIPTEIVVDLFLT